MLLILSIVRDIIDGGKKDCREVAKINASMKRDFITDTKIRQLIVTKSEINMTD